MTDQNEESKTPYDGMLAALLRGTAILTTSGVHPDIPTIDDVHNRPGARLKTDGAVRHLGFGCLAARVGDKDVTFDGGGAMYREAAPNGKGRFAWTWLDANKTQLDALGYDFDRVIAAVRDLIANYQPQEGKNA